jgi:hypothetical protein
VCFLQQNIQPFRWQKKCHQFLDCEPILLPLFQISYPHHISVLSPLGNCPPNPAAESASEKKLQAARGETQVHRKCGEGMAAAFWSFFLDDSEGGVRQWQLLPASTVRRSAGWWFSVAKDDAESDVKQLHLLAASMLRPLLGGSSHES